MKFTRPMYIMFIQIVDSLRDLIILVAKQILEDPTEAWDILILALGNFDDFRAFSLIIPFLGDEYYEEEAFQAFQNLTSSCYSFWVTQVGQ